MAEQEECPGEAWMEAEFDACLASRPPTDPGFGAFYTQGVYRRTPKDFLQRVRVGLASLAAAAALPAAVVGPLSARVSALEEAPEPPAGGYHALAKALHEVTRGLYGTGGVGVPTGHPLFVAAKYGSLGQLQAAARWCGLGGGAGNDALRMAIRFAGLCEAAPPLDKLGWLLGLVEDVDAEVLRDLGEYAGDPAVEGLLSGFLREKVSPARAGELLAEAKERPWEPPEGEYSAARARGAARRAEDFAWAHPRLEAIAAGRGGPHN